MLLTVSKPNLKNEKFFLNLIRKGSLKVTKQGRAFNLLTGKELSQERDAPRVYRKLSWQDPRTKKIVQVQLHRIVWAAFRGFPRGVLNHKDGNKQNCSLGNLEDVTVTENNRHARRIGLVKDPRGEERSNASFTDKQVIRFRALYSAGRITVRQVSVVANCHFFTAYGMLTGKTYSHL